MPRRTSNTAKRRRGTDKPSRDRPDAEPFGPPIVPPGYLSDDGLRVWKLKAPGLQEKGLLTPLDVDSFGLLCEIQAVIQDGYKAGKLPGRDILVSYRALCNAFGLTPDARTKMALEKLKPPKPPSKYDDV